MKKIILTKIAQEYGMTKEALAKELGVPIELIEVEGEEGGKDGETGRD